MIFNLTAKPNRSALLAGVLSATLAGYTGTVAAQSSDEQSAPSSEAPTTMQKLQSTRQEIQQLMTKLRGIQKKATKSNPDLAAQQKEYRDLVIDTMADTNFDPEAEMQSMRSLQAELRGSDQLGEKERQEKMQQLQQKKQQFRSKQSEAMQSQDVQDARKALDKEMRAAMKKQNPQASELIAQLDELQKEHQQLLQKAMQQQQQGGGNQG